jgi:hypothetical protein
MRDPHFYRLRNGTVSKKAGRKGDGEMRKGLLKANPRRELKQ